MRQIKGKSIADYLLDSRKRSGMMEHEAIQVHDVRERIVLAEINQGLPESDKSDTGEVGQEKEDLEDLDGKGKKEKKSRPSVAYDG